MTLRTSGDHRARPSRPSSLRLLGFCAVLVVLILGVTAGSSGAGVADYSGTLYLDGGTSSPAIGSGNYQMSTSAGPGQGAAPTIVGGVSGTGGPTGSFIYVYVVSSGGVATASPISASVSVTNAPITVSGFPAGADLYRQQVSAGAPNRQVILVASNATPPYVDTSTATMGTSLPQSDNRAAMGATGWVDFQPGGNLPLNTSNSSISVTAPAPMSCKGWVVQGNGDVTLPAGPWTVQARVRSGAMLNGVAYLSAAVYVVDAGGNIVATVFGPTDGTQQIQNVPNPGIVATVSGTASAVTRVGTTQHLCVMFWRHQTTAYTTTSANRFVTLVPDDPANQITAHPVPDAFPNTPSPGAPAAGAVLTAIPTFSAGYSDPESSAGTLTFRICADSGCSSVNTTSPAQAVASGASASWAPASLADGTWYWQAAATDGAGGTSGWSSSRSFRLDTVFPNTPTLVSPAAGATTSSSNLMATFTSADVAETGTVELRVCTDVLCGSVLRSGSSASTTNGSNGTWTIAPALGDGTYGFQARAVDAAGNPSSWSAGRSFTLDTTPPETTIGSSPANLTNATGASFSFSSSEGSSTFRCSLNGAPFGGCSSPASYSGLADGSYTFQVEATDQAGNTDPTPASFAWTVDTAAPDTSIGPTQPPVVSTSSTATFDLGSTEAGSTFRCSRDGGAWSSCTSPKTYSGLSDGSHTFSLEATDAADNVDATPAIYSWSIDTTVPSTPTSLTPANDLWMATVPQLGGKFTDPTSSDTGTVQFRLCSDAAPAGSACAALVQSGSTGSLASGSTGNWTPAAPGDGVYHWQARAKDAAGNDSAWTATRSFHLDSTTPSVPALVSPEDGVWQSHALLSATFNDSAFGATGTLTFRLCPDPACLSVTESGDTSTVTNGATVEWHGWFDPADGLYYWQARANDGAGNQSAWSPSRMIHLDKTPPPSPVSFGGTIAENGLTLRWGPPQPADDVANFYIYVDGVSTKSLGGVTYEYNVGPFDAGDTRTFGVVTVDRAGNQSTMSKLLVGVPNVVGLTLDQAEDAAKSRGLVVRRETTIQRAATGGVITSQNPAAGSITEKGTAVKVVLSTSSNQTALTMSASPARVICGAGAVVRLRVRLSEAATVRARLLAGTRAVTSTRLGHLRAGASNVRVKLPRRLTRGTYKLVLEATAGTRTARTVVAVARGSRRTCSSR
jgi:hypothetical protein